jgi:hypothetical protein
MKTLKCMALALVALTTAGSLQSCLDNDSSNDYNYPNALVTVKPSTDGNSFYLQLDDKTTLQPTNLKASPYGDKEVRALVSYKLENKIDNSNSQSVFINWMDSIRTKPTVESLGLKNDSVYGSDPVELINDWTTIAEDGYLTLRFRTLWGHNGKVHLVNLVRNVNSNDPYEFEFRHNAGGDVNGTFGDALVAFRLKDLPQMSGKDIKIKIVWNSFSGKKSATINYGSGNSSSKGTQEIDRTFVPNFK